MYMYNTAVCQSWHLSLVSTQILTFSGINYVYVHALVTVGLADDYKNKGWKPFLAPRKWFPAFFCCLVTPSFLTCVHYFEIISEKLVALSELYICGGVACCICGVCMRVCVYVPVCQSMCIYTFACSKVLFAVYMLEPVTSFSGWSVPSNLSEVGCSLDRNISTVPSTGRGCGYCA